MMSSEQLLFLYSRSADYIWWKTPEEALEFPELVLAQVMDLCTWEDFVVVMEIFSKEELLDILSNAIAGQFRPQTWNFWYARLGYKSNEIPPYPARRVIP